MREVNYQKIIVGELETNCYLVWDDKSKDCLAIDPGDNGVEISEEIQSRQLNFRGVLATHGHFDHVMGALDLKLIYGVPFYCHSDDMFLLRRQAETAKYFLKKEIAVPNFISIDVDLRACPNVAFGNRNIEVIYTPGHTPGGVCFYIKSARLLFSGDTIFAGSRGRTDLRYSSTKDIYKSIRKLMELPADTTILPGHGEETYIERERPVYLL